MAAKRLPLVLTLDQGGHASRAVVFDARGRVVTAAERRVATRRYGRAKVEHSATAVLRSMREAATAAVSALGRNAEHLACAALATQRSSIVCWDRHTGQPLSPVLSWQDRRTARQVAALQPRIRQLHALTGLVLSPHYGASKIAWCLRHVPAAKRAAKEKRLAAGPLAGFLLANLLQEHPCVTDAVNASRTLLLDVHRGRWSASLCELFGVPLEVLPRCVANRNEFGHLEVAGRMLPMTVVTGDQPAALFALGKPTEDCAYINIGTGAFVQRLSGLRRPGMLQGLVWRDEGQTQFALEGTVNGAGSALATVGRRLGLNENRFMPHLSQWLVDCTDPPLFLNGIGGLGAPFWQPQFASRFIGSGTREAKLVAVAESIAFLLQVNLERMRSAGIPLRRLAVSGGLARLDGLCQRLADLSGLPVIRPDLHEATARGLAQLAVPRMHQAPPAIRVFRAKQDKPLRARYRRWRRELNHAL